MIYRSRVQGSNKNFQSLEFNVDRHGTIDTIYIRSNEEKWHDEDGDWIGWIYDETQMAWDEYMEKIVEDVSGSQSINKTTLLALMEVNERLRNIESLIKEG